MTNRERINNMSDKELVQLFRKVRNMKLFDYIDWEKYLSSDDDKMYYKGVPAFFCSDSNGKKKACLIVGSKKMFGRTYKRIILDGEIVAAPSEYLFPRC